jgi:hypothetical protein
MNIQTLGIDIAKNVFQLHGVNRSGYVVLKRRVMRNRARPPANSMHAMSPDFIVEALTNGIMKAQGSSLSPEQRASLADLTCRKFGAQAPMAGRCSETRVFSLNGPSFNGWGANAENWRPSPASVRRNVASPRLEGHLEKVGPHKDPHRLRS